jgi:hypothetical protein
MPRQQQRKSRKQLGGTDNPKERAMKNGFITTSFAIALIGLSATAMAVTSTATPATKPVTQEDVDNAANVVKAAEEAVKAAQARCNTLKVAVSKNKIGAREDLARALIAVNAAEAAVKAAEANYNAVKAAPLTAAKPVTQQDVDNALKALKAAEANLKAAEANQAHDDSRRLTSLGGYGFHDPNAPSLAAGNLDRAQQNYDKIRARFDAQQKKKTSGK